jgi:hypothetical protein
MAVAGRERITQLLQRFRVAWSLRMFAPQTP